MGERPNVLIIMCDQLSAGVLGCYGGPVPTPNLDALARDGVIFTDATCPTPICSPSRASLITGLYPHTYGIVYNVNRPDYPAISPTTDSTFAVRRGWNGIRCGTLGRYTGILASWP